MAGLEPVLLPRLLGRFDVPLNRKLRGFSKGMRQMVAILQAFMCDPELLILDEPTSGLDPLGQRTFNEFLLDEAHIGRSVFMSSHILSEVEKICHRVGVIRGGELVSVEAVERQKAGAYHLKVAGSIDPVIKALARHTVRRLEVEEAPLEEVFLKFYAEEGRDRPAAAPVAVAAGDREGRPQ